MNPREFDKKYPEIKKYVALLNVPVNVVVTLEEDVLFVSADDVGKQLNKYKYGSYMMLIISCGVDKSMESEISEHEERVFVANRVRVCPSSPLNEFLEDVNDSYYETEFR